MNLTITHKPLNQEEVTALGEPLRKMTGINWPGLFIISVFVALLAVENRCTGKPLWLLAFGLVIYFAFLLPMFLKRKSMKADMVLKILAATPLFPVEHQIHLSDEEFSVTLPDYRCACRYDMIPRVYLTHVPSSGDELLLLVLPSYPVIRKSDFESSADFSAFLDKLQADRKRG